MLAAHVEAGQGASAASATPPPTTPSPDIRESHTKPPPGLLGQDDFRRGFAALGAAGLSFDAWMFHPQLPELVDLCRAVPDTPVVLDHLGGPLGIGPYAGRRDEVLAGWRESMTDVAACDNVVLKLGGIGMAIYGMGWHRDGGASTEQLAETWGEPIRWCIETFGAERCMFESNFPVDKVSCTYADLWGAFELIAADASPADRDALFAGTATPRLPPLTAQGVGNDPPGHVNVVAERVAEAEVDPVACRSAPRQLDALLLSRRGLVCVVGVEEQRAAGRALRDHLAHCVGLRVVTAASASRAGLAGGSPGTRTVSQRMKPRSMSVATSRPSLPT